MASFSSSDSESSPEAGGEGTSPPERFMSRIERKYALSRRARRPSFVSSASSSASLLSLPSMQLRT